MTRRSLHIRSLDVRVPAHELERGRDHALVHTACWEGRGGGHVIVCVHGLGGSHLNWSLLAPRLADRLGSVWAPDLAGFGQTPVGERSASVEDNLDLLRGFVRSVSPDRPVVLIGNSMGALLACTLAGRHPAMVARLVLIGPAVPPISGWPEPGVAARFAITMLPGLGSAWLRRKERWLTPAEQVREALEMNTCQADLIDERFVRAQVRLVARRRKIPYSRWAQLSATRTMLTRLGPSRRRLWSDVAAVEAPTLVLHGAQDRLVDERTVRVFVARRPDWRYRVYPDLGHVIMLEDPERVAHEVSSWLHGSPGHGGVVRLDSSA